MFFLIMTGYILLAYLIFPVEDNIWKVPDYYLAISVLTSSAFVVLYERWQKRRKPKHLPNEPLVISDELLEPAASTVITTGQASISMIQRRLGVSYTRGSELMDLLEQVGVVSPLDKKNSRKILLTREQYRRYKQSLFTLSNVRASTVEDELACVDAMEGHDFEHWGADLLRDLGFTKVEVTRGSGDQGYSRRKRRYSLCSSMQVLSQPIRKQARSGGPCRQRNVSVSDWRRNDKPVLYP